jgi:hypothetical protein
MLAPRYAADASELSASARVRPKVRSLANRLPPRTRGPPAIEDTWTMRFGDSAWYVVLGGASNRVCLLQAAGTLTSMRGQSSPA